MAQFGTQGIGAANTTTALLVGKLLSQHGSPLKDQLSGVGNREYSTAAAADAIAACACHV